MHFEGLVPEDMRGESGGLVKDMERQVIQLTEEQKHTNESLTRLAAVVESVVKERTACSREHQGQMATLVAATQTNTDTIRDINRAMRWVVLLVISGVGMAILKLVIK